MSQCVPGVDDPIERDNEREHAGLEASAFEEKSAGRGVISIANSLPPVSTPLVISGRVGNAGGETLLQWRQCGGDSPGGCFVGSLKGGVL